MALNSFIEYLQLEKKYSQHTCEAYQRDLGQFQSFLESQTSKPLHQGEYSHIRAWIAALSQEMGNRSINRKLSSLKAYYNYLQRIGQRQDNPMASHRSLKTNLEFALPLSEQETDQLLDELRFDDSYEGWRDRFLIELLYGTGMRRAELIGLNQGDLDLSKRLVLVRGKGNKERLLPLLPELVQVAQEYFRHFPEQFPRTKEAPLFYTTSGKRLYPAFVYRTINKYLQEVSTKVKKSPHILRHTFATHLLNRGADLNSVKELLGHASLASTQVYTHSSIEELKKVHQAAHPRSKED